MKIEQIRVYAEVLEQGIDFKEYKAFRIQLLLPKRTAAKILTKRNYKKNYGSYIIFGAAL